MAAYTAKYSGNNNRGAMTNKSSTTTSNGDKPKSKALFRANLFHPQGEIAEKVGEVAQVQIKEDLVIPAGSYISVRSPREGVSEKIALSLVVNPGTLKAKQTA